MQVSDTNAPGLPFVAAQYSASSRIRSEYSVVALVYHHADEEKLEVIVVVVACFSAEVSMTHIAKVKMRKVGGLER